MSTAISLTDLTERGCDLQDLRELSSNDLDELLTALGFEFAEERSALEQKLWAMPKDIVGADALAEWARRQEGSEPDGGALEPDEIQTLIGKAEHLKVTGNDLFKKGEVLKATTWYQAGVLELTSDTATKKLKGWWAQNADATDVASPLLLSLHCNLAGSPF